MPNVDTVESTQGKPAGIGRRDFFKLGATGAGGLAAYALGNKKGGESGYSSGVEDGTEAFMENSINSAYFDPYTLEIYGELNIKPLSSPLLIDPNTYEGLLESSEEPNKKHCIREGAPIGDLGFLIHSSQIKGDPQFIGPRYYRKFDSQIVGQIFDVAYAMPAQMEGDIIQVTATPYGNVEEKIPQTYNLKLSNKGGRQVFLPMVLPAQRELEGQEIFLDHTQVFTIPFEDKDGKIKDLSRERLKKNNYGYVVMEVRGDGEESAAPANIGFGVYRQKVVTDSNNQKKIYLEFQGYAVNLNAGVDFRNMPPCLDKIYYP